MKQVLVRGGGVVVEDVPAPAVTPRSILVRVAYSSVSAGTELSSVRLSGMPLYRRALKQPQHVKRVLEIARDQGLMRTVQRVRGRLAAGVPTGYSTAGTVVEVGEEVEGFRVGDRVACAGAGIANHAEYVNVPVNLAVHVPKGVTLDDASSVTLGAIAMQGVRRAAPALGEIVGVIGLGIIGQLTVQLLRASGCRVVGSDVDQRRIDVATAGGMEVGADPASFVDRAVKLSGGYGADTVIVTAASSSNDIIRDAMRACRKKGRVVLVGDVGLQLQRSDMYEKELDFLISTSYGPGRYDERYEQEGVDYPLAYVRWTENRNLREYLGLLASGAVSLRHLPSRTAPIEEAEAAYAALSAPGERPLLVTLVYPDTPEEPARTVTMRTARALAGRVGVALIGPGGFAEGVHVPNLLKLRDRFEIRAVVSRNGATAKAVALRTGAAYASTDVDAALADADVDLVVIATRHDTHAALALRALRAGKHVFVEKPLALTRGELAEIEAFYAGRPDGPMLMTGFNRRFAPATEHVRRMLAQRTTPLVVDYRMNAGFLPRSHWVHGPEGGGRNIGEACHIYDLFGSLTRAAVHGVSAHGIRPPSEQWARNDNFSATLAYDDGSVCTLVYTALGHRDHPKERMEIFADGKVISLDDYRTVSVAGAPRAGWRSATMEKGHLEELRALARGIESGDWPIPLAEQLQAMRVAFDVEDLLRAS